MARRFLFQNPGNQDGWEGPGFSGGGGAGRQETATLLRRHQAGRQAGRQGGRRDKVWGGWEWRWDLRKGVKDGVQHI